MKLRFDYSGLPDAGWRFSATIDETWKLDCYDDRIDVTFERGLAGLLEPTTILFPCLRAIDRWYILKQLLGFLMVGMVCTCILDDRAFQRSANERFGQFGEIEIADESSQATAIRDGWMLFEAEFGHAPAGVSDFRQLAGMR